MEKGKLSDTSLISFLTIDDSKVRKAVVRKVSPEHDVDEVILSNAIKRGSTWYVRAALVEILANRKSKHLVDIMDQLINDKNVEVKLKVIDALLKLKPDKGKEYLRMLTQDPVTWVRKEAQRALQKMIM